LSGGLRRALGTAPLRGAGRAFLNGWLPAPGWAGPPPPPPGGGGVSGDPPTPTSPGWGGVRLKKRPWVQEEHGGEPSGSKAS